MAKKTIGQQFEEAAKEEAPPIPITLPPKVDDDATIPEWATWACALEMAEIEGGDGSFGYAYERCLRAFFLANPDAPPEAGIIHASRTLRPSREPFRNEDPRRINLALAIFKMSVLGLNAIEREDDEAELQRLAAIEAATPGRVRDDERAIKPVVHGLDASDFGKAMSGKAAS